MIGITIISPADNTCFRIEPGTAATGAQMPVIMAEAGITGVTPDPSSSTRFTWLVKIHFQCADCSNGLDKKITDELRLTSIGGKCAITFPHVRGGDLTISVSADLATGCYEKISKGLKVQGVNPVRQEINAVAGWWRCRKSAARRAGVDSLMRRQKRAYRIVHYLVATGWEGWG